MSFRAADLPDVSTVGIWSCTFLRAGGGQTLEFDWVEPNPLEIAE
jgi:hypothetical protein